MKLDLRSHGFVEVEANVFAQVINIKITRARHGSGRVAKSFALPNTSLNYQRLHNLCVKVSGQDKATDPMNPLFIGPTTYTIREHFNREHFYAYRIFIPFPDNRPIPYDVYYY